jgi:hypothetical protein
VYNTLKGEGKHGVKAKAAAQGLDCDDLKHTAATLVASKCMGEGRGRHHDRAEEGSTAGMEGEVRGGHGMVPVSEGRVTRKGSTTRGPGAKFYPVTTVDWSITPSEILANRANRFLRLAGC